MNRRQIRRILSRPCWSGMGHAFWLDEAEDHEECFEVLEARDAAAVREGRHPSVRSAYRAGRAPVAQSAER